MVWQGTICYGTAHHGSRSGTLDFAQGLTAVISVKVPLGGGRGAGQGVRVAPQGEHRSVQRGAGKLLKCSTWCCCGLEPSCSLPRIYRSRRFKAARDMVRRKSLLTSPVLPVCRRYLSRLCFIVSATGRFFFLSTLKRLGTAWGQCIPRVWCISSCVEPFTTDVHATHAIR